MGHLNLLASTRARLVTAPRLSKYFKKQEIPWCLDIPFFFAPLEKGCCVLCVWVFFLKGRQKLLRWERKFRATAPFGLLKKVNSQYSTRARIQEGAGAGCSWGGVGGGGEGTTPGMSFC